MTFIKGKGSILVELLKDWNQIIKMSHNQVWLGSTLGNSCGKLIYINKASEETFHDNVDYNS